MSWHCCARPKEPTGGRVKRANGGGGVKRANSWGQKNQQEKSGSKKPSEGGGVSSEPMDGVGARVVKFILQLRRIL